MRNSRKGIILLLALTLVLTLLVTVWGSSSSSSVEDSLGSSIPPKNKVPSYAVNVQFAGKVLHWTTAQNYFLRNGPDPANGKSITVESWVEVNASNAPSRAHVVAWREDGSLHQELLITQGGTTIVFGTGYPTMAPSGNNNCRQSWANESAVQLSGSLPIFLELEKMARNGWKETILPLPTYPSHTLKITVSPEKTIVGEKFTAWELRESRDGIITTSQVQLDELGRVVSSYSQRVDSSGNVIATSQEINSPIELYAPNPAIEEAFQFTKQSAEVCHE